MYGKNLVGIFFFPPLTTDIAGFDEEHVSSSDDDVEGQNNRSARKSRKRRFIVDEIVRTEETHCQQMKYIYQSIVLELRRSSRLTDPIMPAEEIDAIFSTFEEMLTVPRLWCSIS